MTTKKQLRKTIANVKNEANVLKNECASMYNDLKRASNENATLLKLSNNQALEIDYLRGTIKGLNKRIEFEQDMRHFDNIKCKVTRIVHNKEKNTTVVWFEDETKKILKRKPGTKDCVYTAVAFAIVEKMFGSNSAFQNAVDNCLDK